MNSTIWLALFGTMLLTTGVGLWNPNDEPLETGVCGTATVLLSAFLAYGAANFEVVSHGQRIVDPHPGVAILLGLNVLTGFVIILVSIVDWKESESTDSDDHSPLTEAT